MLEGSVSISDNSRGRHPPHGLCEQLCWSRELGGGEIQQVGLWGLSPSDAHVGLPALPIPSLACPRRGAGGDQEASLHTSGCSFHLCPAVSHPHSRPCSQQAPGPGPARNASANWGCF